MNTVGTRDLKQNPNALIAAQAHRHGAAVMTLNVDDFKPFAHLVTLLTPVPRLGVVD